MTNSFDDPNPYDPARRRRLRARTAHASGMAVRACAGRSPVASWPRWWPVASASRPGGIGLGPADGRDPASSRPRPPP